MKIKSLKGNKSLAKPTISIILLLFLFVFIIMPIITMMMNLSSKDFEYIFSDSNFYSALSNSIIYSLSSAVITTVLATITAYLLSRSSIKHKKIFVLIMTSAMLIPTISVGLGIRLFFGDNGYLDKIFGIKFDAIGSFFGLIFGSVIISFPISFLLIYDALQYENKNIYDACETLGISSFSSFIKITLPYLILPIISTFFASFTLIFSDYGVPMEVAGKIKTLPMYLYDALAGFQKGRGAVIGAILIIPAIVAFIFDLFSKQQSEDESNRRLIRPSKAFNAIVISFLILFSIIIILPQISFVITAFVKRFPNDLSFTFKHFTEAFNSKLSVGLFKGLLNSLKMSLMTALIGTILAFCVAYFTTRATNKISKPLNLLSNCSLAIPGLVLGIGFMTLFSGTNGWFYNTMGILVMVNIVHFFASPYLLAKNALSKLNKNYETVGDTLGITSPSIFLKVIVPSTIGTIVQMFSYFFINSMITISAVAFLCTYANKPLAIFINDFTYRDQQYEKAAVVSLILFISNGIFKLISDSLTSYLNNRQKEKEKVTMKLTHNQFDVLTYLEENAPIKMTQRQLADSVTLSLGNINKIYNDFIEWDFINVSEDKTISLTEKGLEVLEPYKVKRAIILAAGVGHRLMPVTIETPKPLVKVNGVRLIDNMIDALLNAGIDDITIVRGYKKEQFDELLDKYENLKFIDNDLYNETNNMTSLYVARNIIDRCYICEADLIFKNPKMIKKYQYTSSYYGARVKETDDWCCYKNGNYISKVAIGGTDCYHLLGVSYWNEEDSQQLKKDLEKTYNTHGGKQNNWDNIPLKLFKKNYKIEIVEYMKNETQEIDNYRELCFADETYKMNNKGE